MSSGFVGLSARLEGKYHVYYCNVAAAGSRRYPDPVFQCAVQAPLYGARAGAYRRDGCAELSGLPVLPHPLLRRLLVPSGQHLYCPDGVSGGLAGAIGLALADILAGDPGYAITTFVLKFIIGITCGAVAHKVFKLRDQDRHSAGYLVKVIVSAGSGLLLNVFTDPFLGYFRNVYIFGQEYTVAQALTKIAGGVTFVNSVASTVCAVVLYLALRPALERAKLLSKGENKAA